MVDVTSRFYAFMGMSGIPPPSQHAVKSSSSRMYEKSRDILNRLLEIDSSEVYQVQEDIESIEEDLKDQPLMVSRQHHEHLEGIVKILYQKFRESISKIQEDDSKRIRREILIDTYFKPTRPPSVASLRDKQALAHLAPSLLPPPPETAQALNEEAEILLANYQTDVDQVVNVRRGIQEMASLLSMLSGKAMEQEEIATCVLGVASDSVGYVENAEFQLKKAIGHNSSYRFYIVMWFICLSMSLLILDFIRS